MNEHNEVFTQTVVSMKTSVLLPSLTWFIPSIKSNNLDYVFWI